MWLRSDNLGCDGDGCESMYPSRGARGTTLTGARAKGWHIYDGIAADGQTPLSNHLCPRCVNSPRKDLKPAPAPLDGQMALFSDAA